MEARAVECACACAIKDGLRTADLGGSLGTEAMGNAIRERLDNDDCSESMLRAF
jgi:hypothetical protein